MYQSEFTREFLKILKKLKSEDKVSKLEKLKMPYMVETNTQKLKEAVHKYLESSRELGNLWKGKLSSVEEVRTMRRHVKG